MFLSQEINIKPYYATRTSSNGSSVQWSCEHESNYFIYFQGGPEPNIMQLFAKKEGLNLEWVNANFAWGLISPETGIDIINRG